MNTLTENTTPKKYLYGGEIISAPNYDKLSHAKELIKTFSPKQVWQQTGWIYNKHDGKWRFEISDDESQLKITLNRLVDNFLKDIYVYSLSEILSHPIFYYHYPESKDIVFGINDAPSQERIIQANFFINPDGKFVILLTINIKKYEIIRTNIEGSLRLLEESKSIIIHECQHFLQERHDFARARGIREVTQKLSRDIKEIRYKSERLKDENERKELLALADEYELKLGNIAYREYRKQPAEREAWDVYERTHLSEKQRKKIEPEFIEPNPGISLESGGSIKTSIKSGKFELPKGHHPFMKVAKGGSNCLNCKFLTSDKKHCGNTLFVKWYGTDLLPTPVDRYCSDWYEPNPEYMANGGKITPNRTGTEVKPINPERWEKKRQHIEQIANSIRGLRGAVTRDLKSDDEKTRLTALVVAIIDKTSERVGNEGSEDAGHLGVTGFRKKNIAVIGNKVHLKYKGKSGVLHEKSFSDALIAKTLKRAIKDSPKRRVFVTKDGLSIRAAQVNRYLSDYDVTAKDLRGFNANRFIIEKLNKQEVPDEAKNRKKLFRKALRHSAERVGHKPMTLQKHYLMPELQTEYVSNGNVLDLSDFHSGGDLNDGRAGGLLVGETDKDGHEGIVAVTSDRPVILGGGEKIIVEDAHDQLHTFDGKEKTSIEIQSALNVEAGGVPIPTNIDGNITKMENGGIIKASLHERPDMENPVYVVTINGKDKFIQKQDGFGTSDSAWYEVIKNDKDNWETVGGSSMSAMNQIGYTKQEAVDNLSNKYNMQTETINKIREKVKIKMALGGGISEVTLGELDKAKSDLHKAETSQKMMKDANSIIRSKKNVTERLIKEAGLTEATALKIQQPDYAGRIGFATYSLTNNNANIKRLQNRVNMLKGKVKGAEAAEVGGEEKYTFDGGEILVNYPADRVQILFPNGRVEKELYSKLRGSGWVYSPTNKAFQRKITPQAITNAVRMFNAVKVAGSSPVEVEEKELSISVMPHKEQIINPNTDDEFDEAIMSKLDPHADWIGNVIKERIIKKQIFDQLDIGSTGTEEERKEAVERIFEKYKERSQTKPTLKEIVAASPNIIMATIPKQEKTAFKGINYDYSNQYELNKAIEALLIQKGGTTLYNDSSEYSSDEKNFIRKYSGYGGLDKYGTTGKGGLFEYYTPKDVIEKMWALAYKYGYNNGSVLETSVATGEFLQFAKPETRVVGYEINEFSAKICKILYPTAEIHVQPFEQLFIKDNWTMKNNIEELEKFDLVIGNPPYGDFSIVASRYMTGMGERDYTQAKNYVEYFIRRGLDLLKPKGLLIYIVGAQVKNGGTLFLDSGISPVKEYLQKNCNFLDAYRLPDSIFERTGVTSEIIVLQKI